jgi:serine phosphatase RsbU (regulator of sigma subunit)
MTTSPDAGTSDALAWLLAESHELAPADLAATVSDALARLGAESSCLYLADHDQMSLHPLGPGGDPREAPAVDGTIAGRCYALETVLQVQHGELTRLWVPLVDGTARLGVIAADLPAGLAGDPAVRDSVCHVAALAAELVTVKALHSDVIEQVRRRKEMTLQAEMQRGSLPPSALASRNVAVAGMLMPAYEVAGDWFDYALNERELDVAVIDSVGHDLSSAMVSHLVSSALRNARRNGLTLEDAYAAADATLRWVFPTVQFATAALGRLDLADGRFRWISAGHPPPLVVRGGRVVNEVPTRPSLPIGLGGTDPVLNDVVLDPGDYLLLYTDGVTEGGSRGTERFGLDRLADLLPRNLEAGIPNTEVLRRLAGAVLDHAAFELHDDMTFVLVEYRG